MQVQAFPGKASHEQLVNFMCRVETTAAQKAVHERLVFELFGIRESFRERVSASTSPNGHVHRPIRRGDEPILYVTPLRYVSRSNGVFSCSTSFCTVRPMTVCQQTL